MSADFCDDDRQDGEDAEHEPFLPEHDEMFGIDGVGWRLSPRDMVEMWVSGGYRTRGMIDHYLATQREEQRRELQDWLWPRPRDLPDPHDVGFMQGDAGWRDFDM